MKSKLPPGVEALPKGLDINGNQLRIAFMFEGERRREPLRNITKINKASIAYADNKRRTILAEIKENRFDYAAHFPESTWLKSRQEGQNKPDNRTVAEGIKRWLSVQDALRANSTSRNYGSKSKHVEAWNGAARIVDISKTDLELFQAHLLKKGLAPKTVNDIFTIVRGVWADAFGDGIIKANPLDRIKNIERDHDQDTADPFSREELEKLSRASVKRQSDINMILFDCWAGLSVSELIALGVDDIDLENGVAWVRRARVESVYKVPKERSRIRAVELIDPAIDYLRRQLEETAHLPPVAITVLQRDNITTKRENVRFLFRNGISGEPWHASSLGRWFTGILKSAGIRHRGPNQCRHTFASQALSSYVPIEWVARQLGHSDTTMVKKHYGRWIPSDTKSMAGIVSKMMGFRTD